MSEAALPTEYTGPGLIDIQVNGYGDIDFNAENVSSITRDALYHVRSLMMNRGVVAALPTLITDATDKMLERLRRLDELTAQDIMLADFFPKFHLEGPFISSSKPRGAHPAKYCMSPVEKPHFINEAWEVSHGRIGIITLAPELLGCLEDRGIIDRCVALGIVVALGHHEATDNAIKEAIRRGARLCTHLGNGSRQVTPKFRGVIDEQLAEDELWASFIADGHHVPFRTLQNFIRAKEVKRSILVTDATSAAEMAPGPYKLAGIKITLRPDGKVVMPDGKKLAGSSLTLDRAVINVARNCGLGFEDAWRMASLNPAGLLGLGGGVVTVGISADGFSLRIR